MSKPDWGRARLLVDEAISLTISDRNDTYGHPAQDFERVAQIWGAILDTEVSAEQAILCMMGLKLARQSHIHKRDNIVDLVGYAVCLNEVADGE